MTKEQKEAKAVAIYGSAQDIERYGERLRHVLPGGEKLSAMDAVIAADYGRSLDANIFRGELYAYKSRGKLVFVESYKLLTRWARRQSDFFQTEERLSADEMESLGVDPVEDIGYRVWLLREDKLDCLTKLAAQIPFDQAYKIIAQSGTGIVTKKDRTTREGQPQDPPVGWTWDDVAIKRALKNAINRAYGMPSPREIADESWRVGDVQTKPEDWQEAYEGERDYTREEQALLAAANAQERERRAEWESLSDEQQRAKVEDNIRMMQGEPDEDDPLGIDEPPPEPPPESDEPIELGPPQPAARQALTPEVIRRTCRYKARWAKGEKADWSDAHRPDPPPSDPIDEDTLRKVSAALQKAVRGGTTKQKDEGRHNVYRYLFGVDSGKKLTVKEGQAILSWIGLPGSDKIGDIKGLALVEVPAVLEAFQAEAGQQRMELEV